MLEIWANLLLGKMRRLAIPPFSQLRRGPLSVTVKPTAASFRITVHKPESEGAVAGVDGFCAELGADFIRFCRELASLLLCRSTLSP